MKKCSFFLFSTFFLLFTSCIPERPKKSTDVAIDYKQKIIQKAYEAVYNQSYSELFKLFKNEDPTVRYIALNAFATIQDSTIIDSIAVLLRDSNEKVRVTCAYVLGQSKNKKAESYLINAFQKFDSLNNSSLLNATILEACGKCAGEATLKNIASIQSYQMNDSILNLGRMKALFQYSLRGMIDKKGTAQVITYLKDQKFNRKIKIYASAYMTKIPALELKSISDTLLNIYSTAKSFEIKTQLARAIMKTGNSKIISWVENELKLESNNNLKYEWINGLSHFSYDLADTIALKYLSDGNPLVARTASKYLMEKGSSLDAPKYLSYFIDSKINKSAHIELLGAINRYTSYKNVTVRNAVNTILKDSLLRVKNIYRKADVINSLAQDVTNYSYIRKIIVGSEDKILKVAGVEALQTILLNPNLSVVYKSNFVIVRRQILGYLFDALLSKDAGLISSAAIILRNERLNFRAIHPKDSLFLVAIHKIKLPEGIEAMKELSKTIHYWNGKPEIQISKDGFRMLDWAILLTAPDSMLCILETDRGNITIQLNPELAPFAVSNFLELCNSNYFNGKPFHRVVPDFVIQSGCNRGDGFGALHYSIRSEFGQAYYDEPGLVGMASVGPHTESNQFFITSISTPNLDGRYTIFGKVIKGFEVINKIQIGDKIKKVRLK